ncbi:hypothetical protein [Endozoicomonas sp. Mp262]|uniref:hypothetical protein n=1 Tax=Endozoicomonas sp. Mp262 TaxID=2919499 RepID=UPI0021DAA9BC
MNKLFFLIVIFFISIDVNAGKSKTEKIPDTEKNIQLPNRVDVYGFEKTVVNGRNGQHVVSSHNLLMAYSIKNGDLKKGYVYLYLPKAVASKGFRPKCPSEKRPEFHVTNVATYREDYKRGDKDIQLDIARLGLNLQELEFDCSVDEDDEVEIQLQEISTGDDSCEFMSIDYELEFREDTGVGQLVTTFKVPVKTCSAETYSVCCFENMRERYAFPDEELIATDVFLGDQNKSAVKIEPSKSKKGISTTVIIHESLNPDFEWVKVSN